MTIQAQLADGRVLEFPDGTDPSVVQATVKKVIANPLAAQSTASLESAKSAPVSFGDIAKSFGSGVIGGGKSIVDFFGTGTGVSKGLGEAQNYLQEALTPERKAEIARRQELQDRAAQSGSLFQEAKAFLGGVAEAPFQSLAQAGGSSVPAILTGIIALPAEAPAALALGVGTIAKLAVGAIQGVGEMKGGVFDVVKAEYMKQGKTEKEAEALAIKSSEYSRETAFQTGGAALLGALDAVTGAESSVAKAMRKAPAKEAFEKGIAALPEKAVKAPTRLGQLAKGVAEEAPLEGAQGAFGQYGENVALQQAGADVTPMQGVLGAGLRDAAVGALFGGAASPLSMKSAREDYVTDQTLREIKATQEEDKAKDEAFKLYQDKQEATRQNLGVPDQKVLALPAPAEKVKPSIEEFDNPVGNITRDELGPEVTKYVDKFRRDNKLPRLKTFSIEDIKDAQPGINPEGEQAAIDSILAAKTGFTGQESYTPEDIQNAAVKNNVATETQGFKDFLTKVTGTDKLDEMTQPQLHAAFKSVMDMNRPSDAPHLVLPTGTNATRFNDKQYDAGVKAAADLFERNQGKPFSIESVADTVQEATGLQRPQDAHALISHAIERGDMSKDQQVVYRTYKEGADRPTATYKTKEAAKEAAKKQNASVREETLTQIAPAEEPVQPEKVRAAMPAGYSIETTSVKEGETPAEFQITPEGQGKPLTTVEKLDEVQGKIERLTGLRRDEANKQLVDVNKHERIIFKSKANLESMEARGLTGTEAYKKAQAAHARAEDVLGRRVETLYNRISELEAPLKAKPSGKRTVTREIHTVKKGKKILGSFPNRVAAEESLLTQLSDKELDAVASDTRFGGIADRARKEQESRKSGEKGIRVKGTTEGLEKAGVRTPETEAKLKELETKLKPMLDKFGLGDVALNVVRAINNNAEGSFKGTDKLIQVAFNATNPIKTMRHEALHALKELGFFTPQQWKALEKQAKDKWIGQYLENVKFDENTSRLQAYRNLGLTEDEIIEEAIADAFGSWEGGQKPPPGLMAALFKRLQQFFAALRQALTGAGFESADEIFGKIEAGELKAGKQATEGEKLSLRQGVPVSTVPIMEADDTDARAELGLNTKAVRNRFNSVRDIAIALNNATKDSFGVMNPNNLTNENMDRIAKAIADEVGYQLLTTSETGTGTGWYSSNYPNAVKRLGKVFPELENNPTARSVFSAVVAVSSNGERVATNIKNAIKMYQRIRQGKKMIAVGSRRATALENNLMVIQDLLDEHGDDFEKVLLETTTVKDMNAALRAKGEKPDTAYLADTTVPAAAIYFGPKLGAFFANLSGSEGYLTMDLWWSRTFNRMRGLLIPKATDASINTFREMMDRPTASRDEVIAATIPLAAKYKEYGFNTELEHLMKSKEPKEKVNKPKWFAKAERVAGDAYEQLLYEHKLEKIANTINKNEFEMLEEAPFTGTDRKFMYDAARKAQGMLRNKGVNLTLADVQAALWYYEKRLYQKLSGRKADDIGYEEAINSQAAKGIGRARPSVVFGGKPNSGAVTGGQVASTEELRGILTESTSDERKYSLRSGVIIEVAPNPDQEVANKWREMTPDERLNTTKAVANKAVTRVLDELGFKGYTSYFSSGKYEGEVNPNIIIEAPDGAPAEDLRELASVLGYVLDQKAMVAFDENNKSSSDQNTFVKVVPPSDMSEADLQRLRNHIADSVPQADGDTLRDDALLFGNFSAYNNGVETLSDKQYHQAIIDAIESFDYDGTIQVSEPETFHSEMIWPESRSDYLKGTRYGKSSEVQGREGADVRGSGISRLQTISEEAIALRDRWIDARGQARRSSGIEHSKVDIGQPTAEYGQKREGAESVIGVHFSQQPRNVLSSYFHGNGIRGLEKERLSDPANKDIRDRVYFYVDTGKGVFPEAGVGGAQHVVRLNNLYDIQKDPLKIVKTNTGIDAADRASKLERKVLKAGYDGYVTRDPIQNQGFAVLVGDHTIKTNAEKLSLRTYFPTAEEAENAAYEKAPPGTAEFKRFFGGSTIKEEGRAVPMFHASPSEFNVFRENKPIFISPSASEAEFFGKFHYVGSKREKGKVNVYPLWVRAETPFDFENKQQVDLVYGDLFAQLGEFAGTRERMESGDWSYIEDPAVLNTLKKLGFDSFYVKEGGIKNLAVFNANQVKSITGNIGDFGENKDIRYSLPTYSKDAADAVERTTTRREEKGFIGRILNAIYPENFSDLRAQLIDRYARLSYYDRKIAERMGGANLLADVSASSAANFSDLAASVTASAFGVGNRQGGVPVYKNGFTTIDTSIKGGLEILKPLAKFNDPKAYQDYQFWAGSKRGVRLNKEGKEENFTPKDQVWAKEIYNAYKAKGVDFADIQSEMNEFNKGLVKYMVDTGVLSAEMGVEYMKYNDYIPFYRQIEGEKTVGPKIFNAISGVKPPKKLKGSEAPLNDFFENFVRNTQSAINSGMKNVAAQRAIEAALKIGDISGAEKLNKIDDAPDTVQVLENGKQVSYRVADQLFINAVKSLNMAEMPILGIIAAPSNLLRNLVTKDPGFMLANLARDSLSAWVTSGAKITPITSTVGNFIEALSGKSKGMQALLNAGILGGYEFSSGTLKSGEALEKDLEKKYGSKGKFSPLRTFTTVWDALEHGTEASDAATRIAIYERVLADTGNEAEALHRSLEVMNFNRKGSSPLVRILSAAIPFLNARVQGLDVFYRTAFGVDVDANAKEKQKAFFVRGFTLMALSAAYFLAVSDDDEWKKQEQETKDNYWILPGIGKFPTPFEVGFLFKTVPERLMALAFKDDTTEDFKKSMQRGLLNTLAFNPIPQFAKPIIEYNADYNFFTGRPILGQGMQGVATEFQVGPNTSQFSQALGKAFGMSPLKLDVLIQSYTGTMGTYGVQLIDAVLDSQGNSPHASKRFEQLPIIKRFAVDPEARGNITQYYELKNAVDTAVQTENFLLKSGNAEEYAKYVEENASLLAAKGYVSNTEKEMKKYREMRKLISNAEMTADEKRDALTAIGQAENNMTAEIQTIKKVISDNK